MRLEGSLDAFGLPDVLQLLVSTNKTGVLRLRRALPGPAVGHVRLREGRLTAASSDDTRPLLAVRLAAAGLVDEQAVADAMRAVAGGRAPDVVSALVASRHLDVEQLTPVAAAQIMDALVDLLRWSDGEFAFELDASAVQAESESDLDTALVIDEAARRVAAWDSIAAQLPPPDALLRLAPGVAAPVTLSPGDWAVLGQVGGRTTADLLALGGSGTWESATTLADLLARGLVLAASADGRPEAVARLLAGPEPALPAPRATADHREPAPATTAPAPTSPVPPSGPAPPAPAAPAAPANSLTRPGSNGLGPILGTAVAQPSSYPAPDELPDELADAGVSRALLLRLIAGVRSL